MATPRLPFLWPFLFQAARPAPARALSQVPRRGLKSSRGRRQDVQTHRYGTANEPIPPINNTNQTASQTPAAMSKPKSSSKSKKDKDAAAASTPKDTPKDIPLLESPEPAAAAAPSILNMPPPQPPSPTQPVPRPHTPPSPLSTVLATPPPVADTPPPAPYYHENASSEDTKPPHISTPRYVHHFDTYGLVKRLSGPGGWSDAQAVTVMKAVRVVLRDNMELAREGLVSKSNVENESYLFEAACSELRTEVGMRRRAEVEKTRSERTGLQHEVDILGQRVGMEAVTLREELKGMVEGRKMAVREEGRGVDSKIQELDYKITVALNSDLRSDIEEVRWIITKRAITALVVCLLMVIASLKYASGVWEEERRREKEAERAAAMKEASQQYERHAPAAMNGEELGAVGLLGGENPGYISLG